jgi:hypothetical protein
VRSARKPSERLELIWIKQVVKITELIKFTGIIGLIRVLRFIRNFSNIRAGLRETSRVCWLKFCGLVDYNVISLASGQSCSRNGLLIILLAPITLK